jgi:hypothetical protein
LLVAPVVLAAGEARLETLKALLLQRYMGHEQALAKELPDQCPIVELLQRLQDFGGSFKQLLVQFVWRLAFAMEKKLGQEHADSFGGGRPAGPLGLQLQQDGATQYLKARRCLRYLKCGRAAAQGSLHASFAVDAARVGFKGRTSFAVGLPSGVVFWCPPQATRPPKTPGPTVPCGAPSHQPR